MKNPYVSAALFVGGCGLYFLASALLRPYHEMSSFFRQMENNWLTSKEGQSLNDRLSAGKLERDEYRALLHTGKAKKAWHQLSVRYPYLESHIVGEIKKRYPHAKNWR